MRKVFSSLITTISFPIRLLKKSRVDNFFGGLVIGAIFSLIVNIATSQIQEMIQKQRILEALESEILGNYMQANSVLERNEQSGETNQIINYFDISNKYSSDLWTQSSEPLKYVASMDPDIQAKIVVYYRVVVNPSNGWVDKANTLIDKTIDNCFDGSFNVPEEKQDECKFMSLTVWSTEDMAAGVISKNAREVLDIFHPTEDRLNSWFLKLFMGDKAVRILSGE